MGERLRTVVVDNDDVIRRLVRVILEHDGRLEVVGEAANGLEAIELADALRPGGIVIDLNMPGLSGRPAIAEIRSRHPHTVIVVLSTFPGGLRQVEGADAALAKGAPDTPRQLGQTLIDTASSCRKNWPAWERRSHPRAAEGRPSMVGSVQPALSKDAGVSGARSAGG